MLPREGFLPGTPAPPTGVLRLHHSVGIRAQAAETGTLPGDLSVGRGWFRVLCWAVHAAGRDSRRTVGRRIRVVASDRLRKCSANERVHVGEERGKTWEGESLRRASAENNVAEPTGGVGLVKNSGGGGAVNEGRPPRPGRIFPGQIFTVVLFQSDLHST